MTKMIYSKFFWDNWLSDASLRACSSASRGVWMDMLCLAAQSPRYGYVLVGGKPATPVDLSRVTGVPIPELETALAELDSKGVFSRDADGLIYCRRMLREENKRRASSKGGQKGGPATIRNNKGIFSTRESARESPREPTSPRVQESKSPTPTPKGNGGVVSAMRTERLTAALGADFTTHKSGTNFVLQTIRMEELGIDFEKDLIPVIEEWRAEGHRIDEIGGLSYFRPAALRRRKDRLEREAIDGRTVPASGTDFPLEEWQGEMRRFLQRGWWPSKYGPMPHEAGCRAPKALLEVAEPLWNEQGQKPENESIWRHYKPMPFFGSNVIEFRKRM